MKSIRIVLAILFFGSLALSLTTCGSGTDTSSPSSNLSSISTPAVVPAGANQQFSVIGAFSDGTNFGITTQVTWASSSTSLATVNGSGRATAVATGTATITATFGTVSGSAPLMVSSGTLTSITVAPANPSNLPVGVGQQFVAIGGYSDGTSHDITTQVTWSSLPSPSSVATITSSGLATGVAAGTTTIKATSGSISSVGTTLKVTSATLSSIAVTPASPSVPVGFAQQFTATGTFSDGTTRDISNISTLVTWSSSIQAVATVGASTGLAPGVAVGTTTITATPASGPATAKSTTLTVTSATLSSINVYPAVFVGSIQRFAAIGAYSDGPRQDISNEVFWTSTSQSVATINNTGVATALSAGSTVLVATTQSNFFPYLGGNNIQGGTTLFVFP